MAPWVKKYLDKVIAAYKEDAPRVIALTVFSTMLVAGIVVMIVGRLA